MKLNFEKFIEKIENEISLNYSSFIKNSMIYYKITEPI